MKNNQLTKGELKRLMYVENKSGLIEGASARIGWVEFSKTGKTVYFHGKRLKKKRGIHGNFLDEDTGEEYWVSGLKKRGSNVHPAETVEVKIDNDAIVGYQKIKG
jgi:hypothetical protein